MRSNPNARFILLAKHGLVTWGESHEESYERTIEAINRAAEFVASRAGEPFGGRAGDPLPHERREALLADVAPAAIRDTAFAIYFTLAFGVGSLWVALYGVIIEVAGPATGLPIVFWFMAASFVAAAVVMLPVRDPERTSEPFEASDLA